MSISTRLRIIVAVMSLTGLLAVALVGYIGWSSTSETQDVMARALTAQHGAGIAASQLSEANEIASGVLAMTQLRLPDEYLPEFDNATSTVRDALSTISAAGLSDEILLEAEGALASLDNWSASTRIAISGEAVTSIPTAHVLNSKLEAVQETVTSLSTRVNTTAEESASAVGSQSRIAIVAAAGSLVLILACVSAFALYVARYITGSIGRAVNAMERLADNDIDIEVPQMTGKDEVSAMMRSISVFRDNAIQRQRLEGEQLSETTARASRESKLRELISGFEESVGQVLGGINEAGGQMAETANTLSGIADETRSLTGAANTSTGEASANVQAVAQSSDELSISINEIGQQVSRATQVVTDASTRADQTNAEVAELSNAAQRIGDVVTLIQAIAEQTNLLALNATIEAARAGDAGKGFAVVAGEVKALASQTAQATEEISQHIASVQGSTSSAVEAIGGIVEIMTEVHEITGAIATAIEEQTSATQEISRSIQHAASGTMNVARNVEDISGAVDETAQAAGYVQTSASSLGDQATILRKHVSAFLEEVAAA